MSEAPIADTIPELRKQCAALRTNIKASKDSIKFDRKALGKCERKLINAMGEEDDA